MARTHAERRTRRALGAVLLFSFVAAAGSQGFKQVVAGEAVIRRAEKSNRFIVSRTEFARRGAIYSSDGKVLAQSNDTFELSLSYAKVPHSRPFFMAMAQASGIPAIEMAMPADAGSKSRTWMIAISGEKAEKIKAVKSDWRADGVSLRRVPRRDYPFSDVTETLVGTIEEGRTATGLEKAQEAILAGQPGKLSGLVDRTGAFLPMRMSGDAEKATHGRDLTLTIDSGLQIAAVASLRRAVEANNASQGVVVALNPTNGDVLAAASWIKGQEDAGTNGFNPIVMGRFEPGSTFKILTLAEAMDLDLVRASDTLHCHGSIRVAGKVMKCSHGAHGVIDGTKAIAESCNVSAVTWARKIGREPFIDFMSKAGLFTKTDLGLPGEIAGDYNENDGSPSLQLANMGFGQALNLTPIGLASAFSALGNDGVRVPPRLIAKIGDNDAPIQEGVEILKPETAQSMLAMMEATIQEDFGTAHQLKIPGYRLAGKTGTAQKLGKGASKERRRYVSNFVGYVPAEKPRAVILVMIDDPKNGAYYGGTVAGPVFRDVAEAVIRRFNIPKSE